MASSPAIAEIVCAQADQIDWALNGYHVGARVQAVDVLPRFVGYRLSLQVGVKVSAVQAIEHELALALRVDSVRVVQREGTLVVEVPRADGHNVYLNKLLPRVRGMASGQLPNHTALLGLDELGMPLLLCLASPDVAHVLVTGSTGAGKTVLARAMILSLAWYNPLRKLQIGLLDPKGRAYGNLALGHTLFYETEPSRCLARLRWLVDQMLERDREKRSSPRIVVFVDELADLVMASSGVRDYLTRLTQRGREAGIHVVACTQKPTAEIMGALAKANFPTRIVGRVPSADVAVSCAGLPGTEAEALLGRGDFILCWAGQVTRFQAAWASDSDIAEMMATKFASARVRHVPLSERLAENVKDGSAGRPEEPPSAEMLQAVKDYCAEHGRWPSAWWVRHKFGCGHARAQRILESVGL